jgi:hypothetical protein
LQLPAPFPRVPCITRATPHFACILHPVRCSTRPSSIDAARAGLCPTRRAPARRRTGSSHCGHTRETRNSRDMSMSIHSLRAFCPAGVRTLIFAKTQKQDHRREPKATLEPRRGAEGCPGPSCCYGAFVFRGRQRISWRLLRVCVGIPWEAVGGTLGVLSRGAQTYRGKPFAGLERFWDAQEGCQRL